MSLLLQRVAFGISEAAKNWTIVKNKFLVPAKPKRPISAYIIFSNEKRSTVQGSIIEVAKKLGAEWKALPQQQKLKYQQQAKKSAEKYKAEFQQYESKFVEPFKSVNSANLAVKKMYQQSTQKITNITEGSNKLKSLFQNITDQQKKELAAEVDKIRAERAKIQQQFVIPQPQFKTQKTFIDYTLRQKGLRTFSQLQVADQEKVKDEYAKYFEQWNKTLEEFAKKHNLTLEELTQVIKSNQRKLRRQQLSDETVSQLGGPEKPKELKARRTVAGKRIQVSKAGTVRKTATRTTVTKTAAKKTATKSASKTVGTKTAAKKTAAKKTAAKKA